MPWLCFRQIPAILWNREPICTLEWAEHSTVYQLYYQYKSMHLTTVAAAVIFYGGGILKQKILNVSMRRYLFIFQNECFSHKSGIGNVLTKHFTGSKKTSIVLVPKMYPYSTKDVKYQQYNIVWPWVNNTGNTYYVEHYVFYLKSFSKLIAYSTPESRRILSQTNWLTFSQSLQFLPLIEGQE